MPLALALGAFSAVDIQAELHEAASTSKAMQALFGGSADLVVGGYDQAVHLAGQGRVARSFFVLTRRSPLALVASPRTARGRTLQTPGHLAGANVGISAFGSSGQHFVAHLAARYGVDPRSLQFTVTGGGHQATVAAFEHGGVDALVTLPASLAMLRARTPNLQILADATSPAGSRAAFGVDEYPGVAMMATAKWLEAHRDIAQALCRALRATLDWVRAHPAAEFQRQLGRAASADDLAGLEAARATASQDGRMPAGGPDAVRRMLLASYPQLSVNLAATYTDEFVNAATAQ